MREAPSVVIANLLLGAGAKVRAYDPVAMEEAKHQLGDTITYCDSEMEAAQGADAVALITEWSEFRIPNWEKVAQSMTGKVVFDGRNLYRRESLNEYGFDYYGIGQGEVIAERIG
jgi:UDPglucose 6-dehydrogenase